MNLSKILKFYLVLTITISSVAALSYNPAINNYMSSFSVSVVNAFEGMSGGSKYGSDKLFSSIIPVEDLRKEYVDIATSPYTVNFSLGYDPEKSFAAAGTANVELMQIKLKSSDAALQLKSVNFKIEGVESEKIRRVYLLDENKKIYSSLLHGGYAKFSNIFAEVEAGGSKNLSLRADLSTELNTHDRLRLDIEKPADLAILLDGKPFDLRQTYPVKGPYLTIAKPRPWTKSWEQKVPGDDKKE